ncbi:hypothetical protein Q7P35_008355 [Cladosporium inversicolor]
MIKYHGQPKDHNEVPSLYATSCQPSIYALTWKKEAVRLLTGVAPSPVNDPSYDPLRPKRHDSTPFVKDILNRLGHTVNGNSISEEAFAEAFTQIHSAASQLPLRDDGPRMTQLIALTAIHYAVSQGVNFFVCEAFCGGTLDATNVFDSPAITAITKLGMDHIHLLGPSLAHIAQNKAGIMRKGTICVTCEQPPDALEILLDQSRRLSAPLEIANDGQASSVIKALPTIAHQTNAAIALHVVQHILQGRGDDLVSKPFDEQDTIQGLKMYNSPGSFQVISRSPHHFFLDTAHNTLSLPVALDWFAESAIQLEQQNDSRGFKILIYSHAAKLEGMDSFKLVLNSLKEERCADMLIITSLVGRIDGTSAAERLTLRANTREDTLEELRQLASAQMGLTSVLVARSVEEALNMAQNGYKASSRDTHMSCLITGSSYLVHPGTRKTVRTLLIQKVKNYRLQQAHARMRYKAFCNTIAGWTRRKDGDCAERSRDPRNRRATWSELPCKDQLAILMFTRFCVAAASTGVQSYIFRQLRSFRSSDGSTASEGDVAIQMFMLSAAFTGAQFCSAVPWGCVADSGRFGRNDHCFGLRQQLYDPNLLADVQWCLQWELGGHAHNDRRHIKREETPDSGLPTPSYDVQSRSQGYKEFDKDEISVRDPGMHKWWPADMRDLPRLPQAAGQVPISEHHHLAIYEASQSSDRPNATKHSKKSGCCTKIS